jgi:hypothetical protein
MSYCTIDDLKRILPKAVNIGVQNLGTPQPGRTTTDGSILSAAESEQYIVYATQYIDSRLRPYYSCPLRKIKSFEIELESTASAGSDVTVSVYDTGPFQTGYTVRVQDTGQMETAVVKSVTNATDMVLDSLTNTYLTVDRSKISIVEYPDPIPITTCRLACSYILDRLFTAEQAPDVSNYGKAQRNMARDAIDDLLTGEIKLDGQEHTGRRFVRGSLLDAWKNPAEIEKGQERE